MNEQTGPVAFDTPASETPEQRQERITKLKQELREKLEARETQYAIAAGLMAFFTWVKTPFKRFDMLHMFPNRETRRKNHAKKAQVTAALRRLSKVQKGLAKGRVTLKAKRAAAKLLGSANEAV